MIIPPFLLSSAEFPKPTDPDIQTPYGITYKINRYHNAWIFASNTMNAADVIKASNWLHQKGYSDVLVKAPFGMDLSSELVPHSLVDDGVVYRTKKSANIPQAMVARVGTHIIVLWKGKLLFVKDTAVKGQMIFPRGGSDSKEFSKATAARELKEEVGIRVSEDKLELICMAQKKLDDPYNRLSFEYIYLCDLSDQEREPKLVLDEEEIEEAFWINIADVYGKEDLRGLKICELYQLVLQNLFSYKADAHDIHQMVDGKPMDLTFAPRNLPAEYMMD